jgi:hypothetical protein
MCGEPFFAHTRVAKRQRVCGNAGCQAARQRASDRDWHDRNPDYDIDRRLRALQNRLEQAADPGEVIRREPEPLRRLPAEATREALSVPGVAILVVFGRLLVRGSQEEILAQPAEIAAESGR